MTYEVVRPSKRGLKKYKASGVFSLSLRSERNCSIDLSEVVSLGIPGFCWSKDNNSRIVIAVESVLSAKVPRDYDRVKNIPLGTSEIYCRLVSKEGVSNLVFDFKE